MRVASLFAGLTGAFLFSRCLCAAEAPPDVRTVVQPQAQVWCGPSMSDGLYPTNVLRQGERVQVEQELDSGWLVIRPPVGSFSWINSRFVQPVAPRYANYVVIEKNNPVPVLIGSSLKTDRPTKMGTKLAQGAQVRVIGRAMTDEEGTWLPIDPPPGERRFIRKEAVSKQVQPKQTSSSAKPILPLPAPDADTLWRDAERAANAGHLADAVRLYRLAGDANISVNPSRAAEAFRRAHWYEQGNRDMPTAASPSPYVLPVNQGNANVIRPIGSAIPGTTSAQLVSTQAVSPNGTCYQGRLQPAYKHEVNRRYHLMDNRGSPIILVVAGPGVDLSSYAEHNVEVWGQTSWDIDRRNFLLTVSQVRELP
jgi:hypothetical protein